MKAFKHVFQSHDWTCAQKNKQRGTSMKTSCCYPPHYLSVSLTFHKQLFHFLYIFLSLFHVSDYPRAIGTNCNVLEDNNKNKITLDLSEKSRVLGEKHPHSKFHISQ